MSNLTLAVLGAGQRGRDVYCRYILAHRPDVQVVAVAEINQERRMMVQQEHAIRDEYVFDTWEPFFELDRLCDAVIISTNDEMHYEPTKLALEKGYHVLLEKPMSTSKEEIEGLQELAKAYPNQIFMISHVLRYTPFFNAMKKILDEKKIGELVSVQHNENIGYFHMAHSFVRGSWRDAAQTSPIILAKSCHDMDILLYLIGSRCTKVASFGDLKHFKRENAPENSGDRCLSCQVERECAYSAKKIYIDNEWAVGAITNHPEDMNTAVEALRTGPYGRCVYKIGDNNVCDHQVSIMAFENGVTATFNLCAFTNEVTRTMKFMGTKGEIRGHMEKGKIEIYDFVNGNHEEIDVNDQIDSNFGHSGGDAALTEDFLELIKGSKEGKEIPQRTSAIISAESHLMALAAEESRLTNQVIAIRSI